MNEGFIYHQTGFGDHVTNYSIIKYYHKYFDELNVFTVYRNDMHIYNLCKLYRNLKNINVCVTDNHASTVRYVLKQKHNFIFGHEDYEKNIKYNPIPSDIYNYKVNNLNISDKWINFSYDRDVDKEKEVYYDILGLKDNEEYIFLHEDILRGYELDKKKYNTNIKIISTIDFKNVSIFDMLYVIEKAKEVHCFNSGPTILIDLCNIKHDNLNYHSYIRNSINERPTLHLNWKYIK